MAPLSGSKWPPRAVHSLELPNLAARGAHFEPTIFLLLLPSSATGNQRRLPPIPPSAPPRDLVDCLSTATSITGSVRHRLQHRFCHQGMSNREYSRELWHGWMRLGLNGSNMARVWLSRRLPPARVGELCRIFKRRVWLTTGFDDADSCTRILLPLRNGGVHDHCSKEAKHTSTRYLTWFGKLPTFTGLTGESFVVAKQVDSIVKECRGVAYRLRSVLNMRPDLFKVAFAGVPFVDALTTMLDPTIPLTTSEWEEWGDPRKEVFSHCMKSYCPVDNVSIQL
ncbi:hypothetical protein NC651_007907 [Populus alba x Populus x berolinensis]|nr:hypothetical protein NC651_007907 [Populus alba x Populus x berolinensis]